MPSITIRNIPEDIYQQLKDRAKINRRSINNEVIHLMERSMESNQVNTEEILYKAKNYRKKLKGSLTESDIEDAINNGRL